ncbi:hypothetical protein O6H91_Y423900 [Diphasiastrum complanatum]|nr:hypothetical protein O6H91_Y423900 [Diphasiastrum complanatum]
MRLSSAAAAAGWDDAVLLTGPSSSSLQRFIHGVRISTRAAHLCYRNGSGGGGGAAAAARGKSCRLLSVCAAVGGMTREVGIDDENDWEAELIGEISPVPQRRRPTVQTLKQSFCKTEVRSRDEGDEQEWAVRARKLGLETLQSRAFCAEDLERLLLCSRRRKKKFRNAKGNENNSEQKVAGAKSTGLVTGGQEKVHCSEDTLCISAEPKFERVSMQTRDDPGSIGDIAEDFNFQHEESRGKERKKTEFAFRGSPSGFAQLSLQQQWRDEKSLHRALVEAGDVQELLRLVASQNPSILTAKNVATAIHRIARHMERFSSTESERLIIARRREMCELVTLAMEILPECSAQGLSNIAWALSKLGGRLLYEAEMDTVAEAVIDKVDQLNAQNVANTAGAFASMQHSAPAVFDNLALRASSLVQSFKAQELAQVIWSFASLNHPAHPLLDSLDTIFNGQMMRNVFSSDFQSVKVGEKRTGNLCNTDSEFQSGTMFSKRFNVEDAQRMDGGGSVLDFYSFEQLANIAWSYAVLGELQRPFFSLLLSTISGRASELQTTSGHLSMQRCQQPRLLGQIHQVCTCLKLEYSHLRLSVGKILEELAHKVWEEDKRSGKITSVLQKNLQYLLVSTGKNWVYEYTGAEYSLDAALVEEKIAIEVDGPSHFTRNTGLPLGHTVLKRRLLKASGWNILPVSYHQVQASPWKPRSINQCCA